MKLFRSDFRSANNRVYRSRMNAVLMEQPFRCQDNPILCVRLSESV